MRGSIACCVAWAITLCCGTAAAQATPPARPLPYYELYPEYLPYTTGEPVPAGYLVEKNTNRTWGIAAGAATVGVLYTYGLLAVNRVRREANWLFFPVVGPTALLVTHDDHCKPSCFGMKQSAVVIDAIGQGAGAALFIWGVASWRLRLVRYDLVHPQAVVGPMPVGSGYGVGALGSF
jgi:hypothetical protein